MFLTLHGIQDKTTPRSIRVDQGGEFARSEDFRKIVSKPGHVVEPTGSDTPSQNGRVERLNQTFGMMVRSLLYSSGLPPRFWSDALLHSVYLKNRLWHSAIRRTPYEVYFSEKPDLSHLRVFGSLVTSRVSGDGPAKLDLHTFHGVFLGYTATDLNVRYYDLTSDRTTTCQPRGHPVPNSSTTLVWRSRLIRIHHLGPALTPQLHSHPWHHVPRYPCPSQPLRPRYRTVNTLPQH
jgi:hypothetical protein